MTDLIPVLIIDDQLIQREGVARVVEATAQMRVVGATGSGDEARAILQREPVELALVDLVLHHEHGTDIGRSLRILSPSLKVIIYTREKSMVLASEIFRQAGEASHPSLQGYLLTRNISGGEYLLQVYRHILDFGYFIDPDVIRWHYQFARLEKLTAREEECALLITRGLSNSQIAERMVISRRRVENLINSLYQKFNILGDPGDPARRVILAESMRLLGSLRMEAPPITTLVIEDQQKQRLKLCADLSAHPRFRLLPAAADGASGVEAALHSRPDLVLVDLHLPDMDGFQVARRILGALPQTRAILTSREDSDLFRERAGEAGAIAFIAKKQLTPENILKAFDSFEP